ncbi:MAG: tetratricopeptide repeat protein, partial [Bacteroidia bacterium]|nr:tetratricopeptide repeat protein [Bacteroidia bacterium]
MLKFLYEIAIAEKRLTNAESYLNQLADVKKELCGENSPEYHLARVYLANFYLDYTNKLDEAEKIYDESFAGVLTKEIGEQHKDLIDILNHMAKLYELKDKYAKAAQMLKQAKDAANSKYQNDDILFGIELNNVAKLEIKVGDYEAAEKDVAKAIEIIDLKHNQEYAEYKPAYIDALETQARLYGLLGLFDEAERNLDRTRKIIRRSKVPLSSDLSTAEELSALFIQLGRYAETDKLLDGLIAEYESLYGRNTLRLVDPLVNKGNLLLARGDYTAADKVALRVHDLARSVYGENSTKTASTQKLLGEIQYTLGDYDKAEDNFTRAISSQEKQFGRNHIEVARTLSRLALVKFHKGDRKDGVERLMTEARDIISTKLGKDNPQFAEILKDIAVLYISQKKYDLAFNSLTVSENIWKAKAGSKNNINLASIYTLTGDVYYQLKNYDKAADFYKQSRALYKTNFSTKHPEYVKIQSKLAKVYYMQKNYKDSKSLIEESLGNYEEFINVYFAALSEREKAKFWNTMKGDFEFYSTLAFSPLEEFKDLTD